MRTFFTRNNTLILLAAAGAACVSACSGGGANSSAPAPVASPSLGGIGSTIAFDQRVNFTVIVPPPAVALAATRRKHSATAAGTNPYVSPNTGSVTLQIGTVNGQSPRTLPPLVSVNVSCPGTTGCSVPIQNIAAAKGIDRFTVQTFAGAGGTGNLISTGYIDVSVPSTAATSFGGTALTIGGFVQSLQLTLNIPGGTYLWHTPGTGTIDVNAVDPAGAIIIGNDQLANAIQVSLPTTDAGAFTINNVQQLALQQPAQPLALSYNGTILLSATVTASTIDQNSQPVATSLPIPIQAPPPPPTAPPSPVPTNKAPISLYVFDAAADRVIEYAGVNNVEGGQPFSTTPRRIFEVAPDPAANLTCPLISYGPLVAGMAISANGTIYTQTYCTDITTTLAYTFSYASATQEAVPAQATPTPPIPTSSFSVTIGVNSTPIDLKLDEAHNTIFLAYTPDSNLNPFLSGANIIGVPMTSPSIPTTNFGANCLQQIGYNQSCAASQLSGYNVQATNFAVDRGGLIYVPSAYNPTDANSNPILPPGDPSQAFVGEPTVLAFQPGNFNTVGVPISGLAGFQNELGSGGVAPQVAIQDSKLYVYANGAFNNAQLPGSTSSSTVYPGLSGCPTPSSAAVPDIPVIMCQNGAVASYLVGYSNALPALAAASNAGTNVLAPPTFMLGGDIVGGFGAGQGASFGDPIAVQDGFAYLLNTQPPGGGPAEIDVYNVNNVSGFHTDIQPMTRLVLDPSFAVTTIAIGPTGTGIGGAAILRRPARVHHNIKAWLSELHRRQALAHHLRH